MPDKTLGAYERHEKHDAADFDRAQFARHENGNIAVRGHAPHDGRHWSTAGWVEHTDAEMARDGWSPVRECPDPDEHILARDYAAMSDRATSWQERAEKAEQERNSLSEERTHLYAAIKELQAKENAESRLLSPDAITDEMVRRAKAELEARAGGDYYPETLEAVLTAALTEPPKRPEWERVESLLREMPPGTVTQGSKWLVERGVRVVGEERS